jgi:hypothetical protein
MEAEISSKAHNHLGEYTTSKTHGDHNLNLNSLERACLRNTTSTRKGRQLHSEEIVLALSLLAYLLIARQ